MTNFCIKPATRLARTLTPHAHLAVRRLSLSLLLTWLLAAPQALAARSATSPALLQAWALIHGWQLEQALELGQAQLLAAPDDPQGWLLAAEILHMRGNHVEALALMKAAQDGGATPEQDLQARLQAAAPYAAHFSTRSTPHFLIRYLNKDEILAAYSEEVLEAAYQHIGHALNFLPAEQGEKIVVEIYPDVRGLAGASGLTPQEIDKSGTIAVCKYHRLMVLSPLATANGYSWADTLAHELTHLIIAKKSANTTPIWLHEGIAKFYESLWRGGVGENLDAYSERLLAQAVRTKKFITFEQMHPSLAKLPSQQETSLAFAQVFTVLEFLTRRFPPGNVPQLLETLKRGAPLEEALQKTYALSLTQLEQQWKRYLLQRPFRETPGAAPQRIALTPQEPSFSDKPLENIADRDTHHAARLGELLALRGHHAAAIIQYERAIARAGLRYSTVVHRLARSYAARERRGEALALLDKALAIHRHDVDGHLLAGRLLLERQAPEKAVQHFEAVNRQNPFNPATHAALANLYDQLGAPDRAAQERRFFALASAPRPTRDYPLPVQAVGEALLTVVPPRWTPVHINGQGPIASPVGQMPVPEGKTIVEWRRPDGSSALATVHLRPGERRTLTLK